MLPERPALRRDVHVELVEPNHVILLSEWGSSVLSGRAYTSVIGHLDGDRTLGELIGDLGDDVSSAEIHFVLQTLDDLELLAAGGADEPDGWAAFWHRSRADPAQARTRLGKARVGLRALGGADPAPLAAALASLGIATGDEGAELDVVVTGHYLDPDLEAINARALEHERDWMLVKPTGTVAWLGPVMRPGRTACWSCLATRLRRNRQVEDFVMRLRADGTPPRATPAATSASVAALAGLAATAVARLLVEDTHELERALRSVDVARLEQRDHAVVRNPLCPACGEPRPRDAQPGPPELRAIPCRASSDGGLRGAAPDQTLARLRHEISPITGVVSHLEPAEGPASQLVHSYSAGHNFALGPGSLYWLKRSLRTQTGGKGMTTVQAQVSAIGEAIERYCGVHRGHEPARRATYADLGADAALHLDELLHFSDRQYETRAALNGGSARTRPIPNRFDESAELEWTPAWSLTGDRVRYVPSSFCYYGHPESARLFFCSGDTNGCAAGSTLEEAILQAFFELVERDSVAIWWYNRLRRPAVDLDSVALPYLRALRAHYRSLRRELWALDLTADLGIPCFAAVSRRVDRPVEDIVFGFGAHLDPQIALLRAITECNQFLPAVLRENARGETQYLWPEDDAIGFWRRETVARQPWLAPDEALAARSITARTTAIAPDLGAAVRECVELSRAHGLELLVVDQSHSDIELSVARVIVPGLRHFWRRLGPGRLYDVPVALGWLAAPLAEDELNPLSVFI